MGPVLTQLIFCFSARAFPEHEHNKQCGKHRSHGFQPGIHNQKPLSPTNKWNTNKHHKQQNNDEKAGFTRSLAFGDFAPQMFQRAGADIPNISGRALLVPCDGFGGLAVDDGSEQDLPLQLGQLT